MFKRSKKDLNLPPGLLPLCPQCLLTKSVAFVGVEKLSQGVNRLVTYKEMARSLSQIRILQDKIHKVINDIRNINNKAKLRKTNTRKYMANPNIYHNSGRNHLSGENHHPEPDSLGTEEDLEDSSPDSSTSDECSTSTDDTSVLSSSPSETGGRYAQSDPPPEITTDWPVEEERGEIEDELPPPVEQGLRGGT